MRRTVVPSEMTASCTEKSLIKAGAAKKRHAPDPVINIISNGIKMDASFFMRFPSFAPYALPASVAAAVWTLRPRDEQRLDLYEGVPRFYSKQTVTVQLQDETVKALVYIMDPRRGFGLPSPEYYQTVRQGYEDFGLDVAKLDAAVQDSSHRLYAALAQEMHQKRSFDLWADDLDEVETFQQVAEEQEDMRMRMG